jgi:hypothetical protein
VVSSYQHHSLFFLDDLSSQSQYIINANNLFTDLVGPTALLNS